MRSQTPPWLPPSTDPAGFCDAGGWVQGRREFSDPDEP